MDLAIVALLEIGFAIATLALISLGLAIIFGMMKVINFAHGEFLMLGGYATVLSANAGLNVWVSMFVVAPVVVGLFGAACEMLLIRHLYGRIVDTLLATWALGLLIIGLVSTVIGTTTMGISTPLGSVEIGDYSFSAYNLVIVGLTAALVAGTYAAFRLTNWGLLARGTTQNPEMASALGVDSRRVNLITFTMGCAITGLAGGLLAPVAGVVPTIGVAYVAKAFITVICGGPAVLTGLVAASGAFGSINQLVMFQSTPVIGETALLLAAIVLLRFLPQGITGRFFRSGT